MNPYIQLLASNKGKGQFKAEKSATEATIYLYDAIVSSDTEAEWYGGVAPKAFINELKAIDAPVINLRINSPGGSVFAARAMEQAMRDHKAKIIAHVDGYSASAASFLMMAADEIVMAQGGMVMIHKAWTMAYGNANDLRSQADLLEKIDGTLVETYANRSNQSAEQIAQWMAGETWFTADEAIAAGFADRKAETGVKAETDWDLSAYANVPKQPEQETPPPAKPKFDKDAALRRLEVRTRI
jgi:ATP-dependent Clp protease protease subunit